jgi:phosphate transport system protein
MNNLHAAIELLRNDLVKMMKLVRKQMKLTYEALNTVDKDIVEEIIHREKRINALDLKIDEECEQIIALYNPVATDLRFVISALSITSNLERMADLAEGIAHYVKDMSEPFDPEMLDKIQLPLAFETAMTMLDDVWKGLKAEDPKLIRKVLQKDEILDEINASVTKVIIGFARKHPKRIKDHLYLFSTIKKLERYGDLVENIAEDLIFYMEAVVLKHTT